MDSFTTLFSLFFPPEREQFLFNLKHNFKPPVGTSSNRIFNSSIKHILASNLLYRLYKGISTITIINSNDNNNVNYFKHGIKYSIFNKEIWSNPFVELKKKDEYMTYFCKSQRAYFGFCRLARLFKIKRARDNANTMTDFYFNPFNTLQSTILIRIYDDASRTIYTFRASDLNNIITNSLSHSPDFFADPQPIKNPYTNIPFTIAQLYNLYFTFKQSTGILPSLFHFFFLSHFNLMFFLIKNEAYIREEAIKSYFINMSVKKKQYYIVQMLLYNKYDMPQTFIHSEFPIEMIIDTFTPYLLDYLTILYTLQNENKTQTYVRLRNRLFLFSVNNSRYGRVIFSSKKMRIMAKKQTKATANIKISLSNHSHFVFGS
jgi:hypothetical protein